MTIPLTQIKLHHLKMTLNDPFQTSFGTIKDKEFYITEIIDDKGHSGYGESVAFSSPWYTEETVQTNLHIMKDFLIPLLHKNIIHHPNDVYELFKPIKGNNMAKAALETAVWDLYAKRKNITLAQALGGTKKQIDVGIAVGLQSSTDELIEKINNHLKVGYKRIKIKIKPGLDISLLSNIRKHFPDIPLMADANSAYSLDDLDHLKKFDQFNLMMIEQPLASDDIIDHATLQKEIKTPICLDESIHSYADARKAIELGSCKVINIKIGRVGGLSEAIRIHDYSMHHNIPVWCGGMLEAGIGRAHNVALTTLPNFILPGDTGPSSHYFKKDIIEPEILVNNGSINVSKNPGIGYLINNAVFKQVKVDTTTFNLQ